MAYDRYVTAMIAKKEGRLKEVAKLLEKSCKPPSIYKGHYRELFKIWRIFNKEDLKNEKYDKVIDRVKNMVRYDDEMINIMLKYWGDAQHRELPPDYFDRDRNLKITDIRALILAADKLGDFELKNEANQLLSNFKKEKHSHEQGRVFLEKAPGSLPGQGETQSEDRNTPQRKIGATMGCLVPVLLALIIVAGFLVAIK